MSGGMSKTISWVHVGDLHMDEADGWLSRGRLAAIVAEVNGQIGRLLGGAHTLCRLPTGDGGHFTTDGHDVVSGLMEYAQQVTPDMITYWDDAPNVWHHPLLALGRVSDFLVVDRDGPGANLEEARYDTPYTVRA